MKPALDLAALAQTWSDWLNGDDVSPEEQDGDVVFKHLKLAASGLLQPRIHEHRFKKPATIQEAFHEAVQAGIIEDSPEEREDFLSRYQHYATLPPWMR
jgi:hypothetical protein